MKKTRGLVVLLLLLSSFTFISPGESGAQEEAEFWSMFVNNYWNYRGVDSTGFTWTWSDRIARTDTTTFPGYTTYVSEGRQGGSLRKTEWYSVSPTEIRFWRRYFLDDGEWLTATASGGFLWGRYPIIAGDHWAEVKSGTLSGPGFNYAITLYTDITVLGQETVTVDSGTYTAYKTRHIITTVGPNIYDTTTEYYWFVPYLGVVRWESAGNPSETQYLTGYSPYSWRFRDVSASSFAYSQIESVASAGITGGCSSESAPLLPGEYHQSGSDGGVYRSSPFTLTQRLHRPVYGCSPGQPLLWVRRANGRRRDHGGVRAQSFLSEQPGDPWPDVGLHRSSTWTYLQHLHRPVQRCACWARILQIRRAPGRRWHYGRLRRREILSRRFGDPSHMAVFLVAAPPPLNP